jgi:hypothetical protein
MEGNQTSYHYTPLDPKTSEIRLVTLAPGEWDDPIRCTIQHVFLDDNPTYDALSYVWGDASVKREIELENTVFLSTANLYVALQYLRQDTPRVLWVDALCINQANIEERGEQVPKIGAIYTSAKVVCSWIGEPSETSDEAIAAIVELAQIYEHKVGKDSSKAELNAGFFDNMGMNLQARNWKAIYEVLNREYFTRVWILQELALSGGFDEENRCLLGCGRTWFPKDSLNWFSRFLAPIHGSSTNFVTPAVTESGEDEPPTVLEPAKTAREFQFSYPAILMIAIVREFIEKKSLILSEALSFGVMFHSTDPRDKIYGLLGLVKAEESQQINPDYSKPVSQVFAECLFAVIQEQNSLDSLRKVPLNPLNRHNERLIWPTLQLLHGSPGAGLVWFNEDFNSSKGRLMVASIDKESFLHVRGVIVGRVAQRSPAITLKDSPENTVDEFQEFTKKLHLRHPDTVWRALIMDTDSSNPENFIRPAPSSLHRRFEVFLDISTVPDSFQSTFPIGSVNRVVEFAQPYIGLWESCVWNRCLFETDTGYVGLGPQAMEVGDTVAILYGLKFPLVLQVIGDTFGLIGDCYVQGIMNGELVQANEDGEVPNERDIILS